MKRKVLMALLIGTACLAVGCGKKEAETEKTTEATVVTEAETKTESADETEAETAEAGETEAETEGTTEAETASEVETEAAAEAESEVEELGERPDYTALDYVTLGEYKGLSVILEPVTVTEEEIDASIKGEAEAQDKFKMVEEGTVEEGDTVNIDYEGKKDDVAFDGGTAEGHNLTIGSDSFIDGFEDGLIGVAVGDTVDLNLTFPEEYHSEDLAGQDVVFTVTVNYIREEAEITDDLVAELSEGAYSTVDGYREYMRELLQADKESEQEQTIYNELMTQLYNTCTIEEYPQELVDYSSQATYIMYTQYAEMYGMTLEDLIASFGMTEDDFDAMVQQEVQANLVPELILKAIAEKEEITVSEEEYAEGCAEYAEAYGYATVEEFEAAYDVVTIETSILMDKMLEFVKENAVIEELEETEAETQVVSEAAEEATETEAVTEAEAATEVEEATEAETEEISEAVSEAEAATEAETEA